MNEQRKHMALLWLIIIQCVALNVSASIKVGTSSFKNGSEDTRDFLGIPPYLKQATGKPSVILALSTSGSLLNSAYESKALRHTASGFNPVYGDKNKNGEMDAHGEGYDGYFNPLLQYRYDQSKGFFIAATALKRGDDLAWDGSFLNWLTMRRIDLSRKFLIGGKVRQREGEWHNEKEIWVLEGEVEFNPSDTLNFQYSKSLNFSPILNHSRITIEKGRITVASGGLSSQRVSATGFNIRVAVDERPLGLIQKNQLQVNFGLSVYNFDHKLNTESDIINESPVSGQTMHPCYPVFEQSRLQKRRREDLTDSDMKIKRIRLYNGLMRDYLCVPTGVHASNQKIVQVIEEYPLIWGRAPIAEAMVDIGNYIRQKEPYYVSGNEPYGVYGIDGGYHYNGFTWDPYYDSEHDALLPCKPVFIINFTDDITTTDSSLKSKWHTPELLENKAAGGNKSLDKVALALRQKDCRTQGLEGQQNIISYYVYATFGEDIDTKTINRLMVAAAHGGFIDNSEALNANEGLPDPMWPIDINGHHYTDFYTYSKLNKMECPSSEWDGNRDCIPDNFYFAHNVDEIIPSLQVAFSNSFSRTASGGASAAISTSGNRAEGVFYQASYSPTVSAGHETVKWVGDVSAAMIDQQGRLRSDNGNGRLDSTTIDPIIHTCYDENNNKVRVKLSSDQSELSNNAPYEECSALNGFNLGMSDIGYLWQASSFLSSLSETEVASQRAPYSAASKNRYITTNVPIVNAQFDVNSVVEKDFEATTFSSNLVGLLNTHSVTEASAVVNYIRGIDQPGMRSRQLKNKTQRLGDIIHSSPIAVGAPAENLYLMNGDPSYREFYSSYKNRRTVIYVGANDGMLHAFNSGWYDKTKREFSARKAGYSEWLLGQEIWGFVPFNLLPHLIYLTKPEYGIKSNDHAYFVDQAPYVFDAQIFGKDGVDGQADTVRGSTHPNGWGTVLVVGFRSGGGESEIYPDPNDRSLSIKLRPAFLVFDITDPEQPPKLLAEFTHEKLGATMPVPTAITVKNSKGSDWYLAFGSGPSPNGNGHKQVVSEQNAHVLMFNLKKLALENGFGQSGVMALAENRAFVGDLVAADIDLDGSTDVVYFGTVSAQNESSDAAMTESSRIDKWGGKLSRLRVKAGTHSGGHQWRVDVMFDAQAPIASRPNISFDKNKNRWVHFGTGRFYTEDDFKNSTLNSIFGLKEVRNSQGIFAMDTFRDTPPVIHPDSLVDVSSASVTATTGKLNNTVEVSPALTIDTVEALEARQIQFSQTSSYLSGWQAKLSPKEKAIGAGGLFGGVFSQTTYKPDQGFCSVTGESYLYALRYTTGTAWYKHVFETPSDAPNNVAVIEKVLLGTRPSVSSSIFLGETRNENEATIINVSSDHAMSINTERHLDGITSKEVGWRQL